MRNKVLITLVLLVILGAILFYFLSLKLTGYSVEEAQLLGIIGDRHPSNSFSAQFSVFKYTENEWIQENCYSSALEACQKIFLGTLYVKETTELADLDLRPFKNCQTGQTMNSYIYKDYCYGAISENISIINSFKYLCEKEYLVNKWHSCPCSVNECSGGKIIDCKTKTSGILSWLTQQRMIRCKEYCKKTILTECNQTCQPGYKETEKIACTV